MASKNLNIGRHTIRFVYDRDSKAGMFSPALLIFLRGPNGSVDGIGPKGWPMPIANLFRLSAMNRGQWSNMLYVRIPHLTWYRAYRLQKVGGIQIHKLQYRLFS